jgi:hypothetical protein
MKRTPLKRTAWPRRAPIVHQVVMEGVRPPAKLALRTLAVMAVVSGRADAFPKEDAVRSEEYRRLVAKLPCKHCGVHGHSQAAHPNTGKGGGLKTDDRLCFPLCCDRPGVQGCHPKFDQHALYTKAARRAIEPAWGADTRRQITAMGQWPANLERLENE